MELFSNARGLAKRHGLHIYDLQRLFVFHGLHCGAAADFSALAAKLVESRAFRADVSALSRAIRDQSGGELTEEDMLTLLALASGGDDLTEGRSASVAFSQTIGVLRLLLAGIGGWRETTLPTQRDPASFDSTPPGAAPEESSFGGTLPTEDRPYQPVAEPRVHRTSFAAAAAVAEGNAVRLPPSEAATEPQTHEGELGITESESPLGVADRRVERPEPRFKDTTQIVGTSAAGSQRTLAEAGDVGPLKQSAVLQTGAYLPSPALPPSGRTPAGPADPGPTANEQGEPSLASRLHRSLPEAGEDEVRGGARATGQARTGASLPPASDLSEQMPTRGAAQQRTLRERVGRGLGVAAVVLACAGAVGVVALLRSDNRSATVARSSSAPQTPSSSSSQPRSSSTPEGEPSQPDAPSSTPIAEVPTATPSTPSRQTGPPLAAEKKDLPRPAVPTMPADDIRARTQPVLSEPKVPTSTVARRKPSNAGSSASPRQPPPIEAASRRETTTFADPTHSSARRADEVATRADGRPLVVPPATMKAKLVASRPPVYPAEALRQHQEGTVVLNAFITRDGVVRRVDVVRGPGVFVKSAMNAVSWRRYKPYTVGGKPVEVQTEVAIAFALKDQP